MKAHPAGAGKSGGCSVNIIHCGDHPRGCGEKTHDIAVGYQTEGSPPRVRGKEKPDSVSTPDVRITPAGAGKSRRGFKQLFHDWDHPRGCGEKWSVSLSDNFLLGSPPRVRGKADPSFLICVRSGDHPRGCGEKQCTNAARVMLLGSPPRVRGKARRTHDESCRLRITPAGAGKSFQIGKSKSKMWDHPRGCGEKALSTWN